MTYTARLNVKIVLPSGNWFSGFRADAKSRTVVYTYHDRRRSGQVARHYEVTFKDDLSTVESVTTVSALGGRVEHFKTVSIRDDLASILRAAAREAFEEELAEEVEQAEQPKEEKERLPFFYSIFLILLTIMITTGIIAFVSPEGSEVFEICRDVFYGASFGAFATSFLVMSELS